MLHALALWLFCFGLWLLLSGYFDVPLLLGFGVLSCALVVFVAWRTEVIDPEERPLRLRQGFGKIRTAMRPPAFPPHQRRAAPRTPPRCPPNPPAIPSP